MTNKIQEQNKGLTLENLARSIPARIHTAREKINSNREVKKKASKVWDERGEKYDAFSSGLGNTVANFLKDYVAKLWPTIKELLESSEEESFDVDILHRKFMREQPYLSFVPNGDSQFIWYYSGFRSGSSNYEPTNISTSILEEDQEKVQDLGRILLSEKYFYENACYSDWDKTVSTVPKIPSEQEVKELYEEFTKCILTNTTKALDELMMKF